VPVRVPALAASLVADVQENSSFKGIVNSRSNLFVELSRFIKMMKSKIISLLQKFLQLKVFHIIVYV